MRNIKFVVICILAVFCCSTVSAQGVKIYKNDNTVIEIPYTELDSIVAVESFDTEAAFEFVDMGLSVKWASMNVGATSPEDYGSYFAWGEIEEKSTYTDDNSMTTGVKMQDIAGNVKYDAAAALLGDGARLPTKAELDELLSNCNVEYKTVNGIDGRRFVSKKNGNSIFLPASGIRNDAKINFLGTFGAYWTSTPKDTELNNEAFYLDFQPSYTDWNYFNRYHGCSIRAVKK